MPAPEPAAGPPWDAPLDEAPLVFVDLEMTGLQPETDRVLELCAERVVGAATVARLCTLIRPDDGTHGNQRFHGISAKDLADAPTFASVAEDLTALLEGGIVVAHAARHDVGFIEAELHRAGRPVTIPFFLDTLTLSRRAFAYPSHALGALCKELRIDPGHAHRAGDDVRALRELFGHIRGVIAPATARELWHVRIGKGEARPDIIDKALHALGHDEPVMIRYRAARRPPEDMLFRITGVRTDLEPPRVLGYMTLTRSRRELRGDRILAIAPVDDD